MTVPIGPDLDSTVKCKWDKNKLVIESEDASLAYFFITPVSVVLGGCQASKRFLNSASLNSTSTLRCARSIVTISPSRNAAIGPPTLASGAI